MASIFAARPPQLDLCSRCPISNCRPLIPISDAVKFRSGGSPLSSFRSKNTKGLKLRQRPFPILASDSSDGNYIKEGKDESQAKTDDAQGPPFLTILAGLFTFFLICWIISSTVMSLISLVVKLIPLK